MNTSEMGTGKTEVAIRVMQLIGGRRNLVVCPSNMVLEWKDRIHKYMDADVRIPIPYEKPTHQGYRLTKEHFDGEFLIVNYEMLRVQPEVKSSKKKKKKTQPFNYLNVLKLPPWDTIWFDEAHKLKGPETQQTIGAYDLVETSRDRTDHIHPITGTPFLNYPNELWSPLHMLYPEDYPDYWEFAQEFCYVRQGHWGPQIVGARKKAQPKLRELMSKVSIRREKVDVLPFLPPKQYRTVPLAMGSEQRRIYDTLEKELKAYLDTGASIQAKGGLALQMRQRQWALEPKLLDPETKITSVVTQTILDLAEGISRAGEQFAVFSWFSSYLELLSTMLDEHKISNVVISGRERSEIIRREKRLEFQAGKVSAFLGSIETMVGIDVTNARYGIFADRYWVPKTNEQAEDRLHRPGQENKVIIIDLKPTDSVYSDIDKVLTRKEHAFDGAISLQRVADEFMKRVS